MATSRGAEGADRPQGDMAADTFVFATDGLGQLLIRNITGRHNPLFGDHVMVDLTVFIGISALGDINTR